MKVNIEITRSQVELVYSAYKIVQLHLKRYKHQLKNIWTLSPHLFKVGVNLKHGWAPSVISLSPGVIIRDCVDLGLDSIHLKSKQ